MKKLVIVKNIFSGTTEGFPSVALKKGEIFTPRSREEYNALLCQGVAYPAELLDKMIEAKALISASLPGGLVLRRGESVFLDALTYTRLAVMRHVVPVDGDTWSPDVPAEIEEAKIKKLYPDAHDAALAAGPRKSPWWDWRRGEGKA